MTCTEARELVVRSSPYRWKAVTGPRTKFAADILECAGLTALSGNEAHWGRIRKSAPRQDHWEPLISGVPADTAQVFRSGENLPFSTES